AVTGLGDATAAVATVGGLSTMVIPTDAELVIAPPAPVLPRSSTEISIPPLPTKFGAGEKFKPFNAVLISATVPAKVIPVSALPVPLEKTSPVLLARLNSPLV